MSTSTDTADRLLSVQETAELLGVEVTTLATWRSTRRYSLRWVKVGRSVKYRLSDVMVWIESRTEQAGA